MDGTKLNLKNVRKFERQVIKRQAKTDLRNVVLDLIINDKGNEIE